MILGNLFPLGVLQLGDVVTNGYWHARSIEFFRDHAVIEWLRMPGDVVFIAGVVPLVYLTAKAVLRPRGRCPSRPAGGDPVGARCSREVAARHRRPSDGGRRKEVRRERR